MSDTKKQYVTAVGFVQFDPQEREANGKQVVDLLIKTPGGDGKNIRVTVWPEILVTESLGRAIEKGDFIAVDGGFSSSTYQGQDGSTKNSLQISAFQLNVNGTRIARADREVVAGSAPAATGSDSKVPF